MLKLVKNLNAKQCKNEYFLPGACLIVQLIDIASDIYLHGLHVV